MRSLESHALIFQKGSSVLSDYPSRSRKVVVYTIPNICLVFTTGNDHVDILGDKCGLNITINSDSYLLIDDVALNPLPCMYNQNGHQESKRSNSNF